MIIKIETLKELPYKCYTAHLLKLETDIDIVGDKTAYLFISKSPKCIYLFVDWVDELHGNKE